MGFQFYLITISAKGILSKVSDTEIVKGLGLIKLTDFREIPAGYLNPNALDNEIGMDPRCYAAYRPKSHPITKEELRRLEEEYNSQKRIIKIYPLGEALDSEDLEEGIIKDMFSHLESVKSE